MFEIISFIASLGIYVILYSIGYHVFNSWQAWAIVILVAIYGAAKKATA